MKVLNCNQLQATINPALGGSMMSLRLGEWDVLRPTAANTFDPFEFSAFPLLPFSGRIANGTFRSGDGQVLLPNNFAAEPHVIHGQGWQCAWSVVEQTAAAMTLSLHYGNGPWPWEYQATQRFELQEQQLTVELELTNLADSPMPAGIGWHPYFPKGDARLQAKVAAFWPLDKHKLPSHPQALESLQSLRSGASVAALDLDNAFDCEAQPIVVQWRKQHRRVTMTATDRIRKLVLYTPPGHDFFCVEPVSHIPDSFNNPLPDSVTGTQWLAPTESISASVTLQMECEPCF